MYMCNFISSNIHTYARATDRKKGPGYVIIVLEKREKFDV